MDSPNKARAHDLVDNRIRLPVDSPYYRDTWTFIAELMDQRDLSRQSERSTEQAFEAMGKRALELEAVLRTIASYDDKSANEYLEDFGSYSAFDEPGSVSLARDYFTAQASPTVGADVEEENNNG